MSKSTEKHLQSNEIRIPKKPLFDVNASAAQCQYFKSSFARSLAFSVNGGNNQNLTKSLDFDINFGLTDQSPSSSSTTPTSASPIFDCAGMNSTSNSDTDDNILCNGIGASNGGIVKTLWNYKKAQDLTTKLFNASGSTSKMNISSRKSLDSSDIEVLRLRKECQNLIEENRRLMNIASGTGFTLNGVTNQNVETVILQTQVETLQWQLKQVDSSRQMYRAVMEEVSRYLEKCQRLDSLQIGPICRSKSVLQVSKPNHDSDSSNASSPKARSSTNLMDVPKVYTKKQLEEFRNTHPTEHDCASSIPACSYSTFSDFTWRRTPKRTQTLPVSTNEIEPERLAKEAYRLLRTVRNLLNTQEPLLTQSTNALDNLITSTANSTLTVGGNPNLPEGLNSVMNTRSNVGFNRKYNMRGSRLSLRSSTDDSVHSTSSSNKTETDEDNMDRPSPPLGHHHLIHNGNHRHSTTFERIKEMMISSSVEDESGFSSMNSFQEIGLPLGNSTMTTLKSVDSSTTSTGSACVSDDSSEIRDNTVIPIRVASSVSTTPSKLTNQLGIPSTPKQKYEHHSHFANHRRCDSAPVVPPKLKLHSNDDNISRVLWV